jgi:SAM-dependent methyltransferase
LDKNIKSPVTAEGVAELVETIPVDRIVAGYKELLGMDVSSYFNGTNEVAIYQCTDTGFRFYYPLTIFADEKFYAFLQQKDFYYSNWNWEHEEALKNLATGSKILEVGCGTGSFISRLQEKGFDCTGLELNESAAQVCRAKNLVVYTELLDKHLEKHAGEYDAVCAFQVLEHVYDVRSFLNESLQCLKKGGKLIVAVPNNNPYFFKYDKYHTLNLPPHHSGLWNKESFRRLPDHFPVSVAAIKAEPLMNRDFFLSVYMDYHKMGGFYKKIRKIGPGIVNRLAWPLKFFVQGKTVLAVFIKK